MKSFDQFQNESFVGKAVGLMNKAVNAAKNIKVAKPTTGPMVPPKKPTPGQIARSNPAAKAAALKKQAVQNKAAQQPKKTTTVATPVTKGPFTQTTKSGNKDMPGAIVKKTPSTGRKIGDFVKKAAGAVGRAASKVGSAVNKVRKDTRPARENIRTGVAKVAANKGVREFGSALNQARKALPTAADYRTGQEGEVSGFGGSFSGRSVRGVSKALGAQGKEFEDSTSKKMKGAGRNRPQEVVQRGRELDSDGKPIEKRRDTSFKGALGKMVDRATMTTDKKAKKPKPEEPKSKVTAVGVKTPSDSGAAKVTAGKGEERREAQSGGKSKGTGTRSIRTGTRYVERPKKEKPKKETVTTGQEGKSEGDTDKIEVGASGRQMRVTGGSDSVPVRFGKPGVRRGRPPKKDEKSKPDKTSPGQLSLLDGESKVKTDSKKKEGEGLGSKVGKAVKTGAQKVATATGDAVKTGAKKVATATGDAVKAGAQKAGDAVKSGVQKAGKAVKDGAVKVGKGIKDEVVSGAKELSKDIENKVAAGKKKRDETREKTKVKVTTNYTKPKKGEEMKVPEKKDKVTVSTSKDTTKEREKQKKQAPKALAQAVANRAEADAAKDAVSDMKKTPQMGKVTDDVRSQLSKTLAKTESDPKAVSYTHLTLPTSDLV